ncbi:hypothetical protein J6590_062528 [Homalodisca vitripennis]|nr:hypothetical protein J6590_062528 [Homalodisca vitripennis]
MERCLGAVWGRTVERQLTDASLTRVVACNQKHSGEHPVAMRSLLSPLTKTVSATGASLATPPAHATTPAHAAPPALATLSTPTTTSALPAPPVCSTPGVDLSQSTTSIYNFKTPEDPSAEISRLKQEIKRLENEFQKLLDHTIESDTRLLEYTDQVFPVNKYRVNQIARASATVDCGVQCEPNPSPPGDPAPATVDSGVQYDMREQSSVCQLCAENTELLRCFKTTIEVLEAENQCLKQQNTCESASLNSGQPWTEVKNKNTHLQYLQKIGSRLCRLISKHRLHVNLKEIGFPKQKRKKRSSLKTSNILKMPTSKIFLLENRSPLLNKQLLFAPASDRMTKPPVRIMGIELSEAQRAVKALD